MESQSSKVSPPKVSNLDSLPDSENEFWENAEVHTNITPQKVHKDEPHYFIRKSGHEAVCSHCDWGFVLDPGDKIIDGHLFDRTGKLVL